MNRLRHVLWSVVASAAITGGAGAATASEVEIERRKNEIVRAWALKAPRLDHPNPRVRFARLAANALAMYHLDDEVIDGVSSHARADAHIIAIHEELGIADDHLINDPELNTLYHFILEMPLLTRIWMDPTLRGRMSPEAREAMKKVMWNRAVR